MTDGAGLISLNLAKLIPSIVGGQKRNDADELNPPLTTQIRHWQDASDLIKGALSLTSVLPSYRLTVLTPPSLTSVLHQSYMRHAIPHEGCGYIIARCCL